MANRRKAVNWDLSLSCPRFVHFPGNCFLPIVPSISRGPLTSIIVLNQ